MAASAAAYNDIDWDKGNQNALRNGWILQGATLAELAELEEPKRNRAPSTKVYRHPENPALGRLEVMVAELSFGEIEKRGRNGQVAISGRICQNSDLTRPKTSQKPVGPFDLPTMHAVNLYRVVTCEIG